MGSTNSRRRWCAAGVAILAVLAASPAWAGEVLTQGADLWQTATGFTFTSFRSEPIPAGFFCAGSKPFTGTISLQGRPLVTQPAGALGKIDTIVRRLEDAVVDAKGEASTHIQLMALSLASVKPVDTGCGLYDVAASLAGRQPVTTMRIVKTSADGGSYVAPLELDVKLTFTPVAAVAGHRERRDLVHHVSFGPGSRSVWSYAQPVVAHAGPVEVDTDGDGVPDTLMPGPSNFRAGVAPASTGIAHNCVSCHCTLETNDPPPGPYQSADGCDHLHCVNVTVAGPCPATGVLATGL